MSTAAATGVVCGVSGCVCDQEGERWRWLGDAAGGEGDGREGAGREGGGGGRERRATSRARERARLVDVRRRRTRLAVLAGERGPGAAAEVAAR